MVTKKLKKLIQRVSKDPLHLILGLDLVVTGLMLLTHRQYFFWPPNWQALLNIENNYIIGIVGISTGIGLICWGIGESARVNRILLALSAAYLTWLGLTELMHAVFAPFNTPRMYIAGFQDLIMVLLSLYLAKIGPSNRDNK